MRGPGCAFSRELAGRAMGREAGKARSFKDVVLIHLYLR